MSGTKDQTYEFNNFRLEVGERRLLRDGEPVVLSSKAFDLLTMLVENNGRLIAKEELYAQVWKDQIVEESNLTVQMSAIRRALGERRGEQNYINTVIGSGYRFTADVREVGEGNDDILVVESDTIERIVIERQEQRAETRDLAAGTTQVRPRRTLFGLAAIGLVLVSAVAGLWVYRGNFGASADTSNRQMTMVRLTDGTSFGAPTISPDGRFVAYMQNSFGGSGALYLHQTDTNTVVERLPPGQRTYGCLNFSPDNSQLYYIVFDERDPEAALYSVPVLGGTPKRLIGGVGACATISPDGKHAAFIRDFKETKRRGLMIAALDGSSERTLLDYAVDELGIGMALAWAPNGKFISVSVATTPRDLAAEISMFGVDIETGAMSPLSGEKFSAIGKASWTSDGRSLVFVASRPGDEPKLFLMNYPSGETRQISGELESFGNYGLGITNDATTLAANVWERKSEIWSLEANGDSTKAVSVSRGAKNGLLGISGLPDGRITYIARLGDNQDVWTARPDGSDARALTTDALEESHLTGSPDGRYIVFASNRSGGTQIFRMNSSDGSEVTQLTFGDVSNTRPDISPDGNWVAYASTFHEPLVGRRTTIWKVPLGGGAPVQLTDYESGSPVFSPDGQTLACVLRSESRAKMGQIAIVSADGGQPLKQFQVLPFEHNYQTIRWEPDGSSVVFRRPEDKGVINLWRQPLSGEAPKQLTDFQSNLIWDFAYSRDGARIFLARGTYFVDVVLIKNFR